jgi:hypothetical protein
MPNARNVAVILLVLLASAAPMRDARAESVVDNNAANARLAKQQRLLSSLWTFATLNYLYCDVLGLMDANLLKQYSQGEVNGIKVNETVLLGGVAFMQVPLSMVFLSTALPPKAARIANIAAGAAMTAAQTATLFVGKPTSYYLFSSGIEIATTAFITGYAIFGMKPPAVVPSVEAKRGSFFARVGFRF